MFSLHNRGELPPVVEHEFENFNSRLKGLWLAEHNEDGTHVDEIARTDLANVFSEGQEFANGQPLRIRYGLERSTRYGAANLSDNVYLDPLLGWSLDDTAADAVIQTHNSDGFTFYTVSAGVNPRTPVAVLGIDQDNVVQLYEGQLKFPATQNASSDVNTLDDYEEGTWTPTIGGATSESGQVYSLQNATYVKTGKSVVASGSVALSTLGTITGMVQIKGLPFVVDSALGDRGVGAVVWGGTTTALNYLVAVAENGGSIINLYGTTAAATALGGLAQADLSNTTAFAFTVVYRAAS